MTNGLNVVSTDFWRVLLPDDWKQKAQTAKVQIHFKAVDDSKGAYFLAWGIEEGSARRIVEERSRDDFEGLQKMDNGEWKIIDQWTSEVSAEFGSGIDCFNEESSYRIVCQTLACGPWAIRATFHDYYCTDYRESKEWFDPLIRSFGFNHEKADSWDK